MLKPDYKQLWSTMVINESSINAVNLAAQHISQFKNRYANVGALTCSTRPIPWYVVGLIHYMEAGQNFARHLHNGDPLSARTIHVPAGRPSKGNPPFTWEASAVDALTMMGWGSPKVWDYDDILDRMEDYNGHGYWERNIYTPYLWSRTNHYVKGKFSSDGHFDPNNISNQIGAAPILKTILDNGA